MFIHLGNLNLITVLSWLPWILAAFDKALESARWGMGWHSGWGWAAFAGVLLAVSSYAGHAQSTLYVGIALAIYTLGWIMQNSMVVHAGHNATRINWACREQETRCAACVGAGAGVLLIAVLLMGPILLPALR